MKKTFYLSVGAILFGIIADFGNAQTAQSSTSVPTSAPPTIISRDANSRVWERTEYVPGPKGQIIQKKHHYTELATGLCYQQNGQWLDSQEVINILPDGSAAATNGQHQAYLPADIYNGSITLVTPDGLQLRSRPIGLSYDDGTNTVLFAELTNSVGQLLGSNQIIYTNAFVGIDADLLYTYRKGGFEQDIVFRKQPPAPEQFGLNLGNTRLQVLTEFLDSPIPVESVSAVNPRDGLQDSALAFGATKMKPDKAFLMGDAGQKSDANQIHVYKSWVVVNGRALLVEELPYERICPQLSTLPAPSTVSTTAARSELRKVSSKRLLPPAHLAHTESHIAQLAMTKAVQQPGIVLDFATILSNVTNYTFKGDTTYYISGEYNLSGTTVFEGGTVIKMNGSGQIDIDQNGTVVCKTGPYLPAVFTSVNDDSIAEPIWSISSGTPVFNDVTIFLEINSTNVTLHDCRFSYSYVATYQTISAGSLNVWNSQFFDVDVAIYGWNLGVYNVLIGRSTNLDAAIFVEGPSLTGENITADSGYALLENDWGPSPVPALTNCLITSQPMYGASGYTPTPLTNAVIYLPSPASPVYQTVGGSSYYLTNNSPYRGAGTANIDQTLLSELQQKTTWPPVVYDATNISSLGMLGLAVPRDTNSFTDIGYHYDPIDYAFGGCDLYGNLTITDGTAIAWFEDNGGVYPGSPYGISLDDGANLSFNGNATEPCIFVRSEMVQEGGNGNWGDTGWNLGIVFMGNFQEATVSATFTKWTSTYFVNILQDRASEGQGFFKNCEFYNNFITTWNVQNLDYTNCLLFRPGIALWNSPNFVLENCTVFNGGVTMNRSSAVNWLIENCSFDGTGFNGSDNYIGDTNYTTINFNAYNTNNLSWQTYPLNPSYNGMLDTIGANDQMVTNYNWEGSRAGNFYLPATSPILKKGSITADQLGLYWFTTQTNQAPQETNIVDIGYHYQALDLNNDVPSWMEEAADTNNPNQGILSIWIDSPTNGAVIQ
jgi:hypothetical protein